MEVARDWLEAHEDAEAQDRWLLLCFLAGRGVDLPEDERNGALRRAELLLAGAGDPRRRPALGGRAVGSVATDLDLPERRAALRHGLESLRPDVTGLPGAEDALRSLLEDQDLAWQVFACSLLVEHQADD